MAADLVAAARAELRGSWQFASIAHFLHIFDFTKGVLPSHVTLDVSSFFCYALFIDLALTSVLALCLCIRNLKMVSYSLETAKSLVH